MWATTGLPASLGVLGDLDGMSGRLS